MSSFLENLSQHSSYKAIYQDPCAFSEGFLGLRSPLKFIRYRKSSRVPEECYKR